MSTKPSKTKQPARLRLVGVVVQPQVVADDGDTLEPVGVEPFTVPASNWPPDMDDILAELAAKFAARAEPNGSQPAPQQ